MAEELGRVSRIVCDAPADDPNIMEMDCSVLQSGGFEDIGRIHHIYAAHLDDTDIDDIRYVDVGLGGGGSELRTEIDLQGTQECEISKMPGDEWARELVCDEPS